MICVTSQLNKNKGKTRKVLEFIIFSYLFLGPLQHKAYAEDDVLVSNVQRDFIGKFDKEKIHKTFKDAAAIKKFNPVLPKINIPSLPVMFKDLIPKINLIIKDSEGLFSIAVEAEMDTFFGKLKKELGQIAGAWVTTETEDSCKNVCGSEPCANSIGYRLIFIVDERNSLPDVASKLNELFFDYCIAETAKGNLNFQQKIYAKPKNAAAAKWIQEKLVNSNENGSSGSNAAKHIKEQAFSILDWVAKAASDINDEIKRNLASENSNSCDNHQELPD